MKKWMAALMLVPAVSWGWMGIGGGTDYGRDAANMFYCANPAGTAVTTQAGLSKTNPALTLINPYGSNKNLVLLDVGIDVTASPAAAAQFMLAYSTGSIGSITFSTTTTIIPALVPAVALTTTTVSAIAQCYRGATLVNTPIAFRYLGGTTGAAAIGGVVLTDYTNGKVVVPPGSQISIQSTSAAAILAHFLWREEPN